ncbi:MAG: cation:proton antiporter [Alphaproteobacteria bacterium]|nr:cation:proton antiporter [Alphaproteobacteria bacterium]
MNWTIAQIASVVLCAMGSGLAFSSFGYTPILGYIIAGIILGPSGFQFITDRNAVSVFSEMGVILLLFVIGLGLSFERIRNIWKTSFVTTLISMIVIYATVFVAGYFLKLSYEQIMLITFCVTLSSTAVTVKSLATLKEQNDRVQENTFGILVAQDIIALAMVLVINFLGNEGTEDAYRYYRLAGIVLFSIALFVGFTRYYHHIHKLTNFLYKHDSMMTMTVFGICLGCGVVSEIAGFSAPFGAFIAGVALGNSNLKEDVKRVAFPIEDILLMTFFLSVGLLVDLHFVWAHIGVILSALLFVTLGKTIINVFVLKICRFSTKDSFVISVLLGHIGEFSFMLAYAARKVGMIDDEGVKFLISLTALSLFLSPLWLIFAARCRALTRTVAVSSWEFFTMATRHEIVRTYKIFLFLKSMTIGMYDFVYEKSGKAIKRIKEKKNDLVRRK